MRQRYIVQEFQMAQEEQWNVARSLDSLDDVREVSIDDLSEIQKHLTD